MHTVPLTPAWRTLTPAWLDSLDGLRAPSTIRHRRGQLVAAASHLPAPRKTSPRDVAEYLRRFQHPTTYASNLAALRGFFRWCVASGHVQTDPTAPLKAPPKPTYYARPVPDAVLSAVLPALDTRHALVLVMGAVLGMRRAEIAASHRDHYDAPTGVLTVVGKGRRLRTIPVPAEYAHQFEQPRGFYLPSPSRPGPVVPNTVYRMVRRSLLNYSTHQLRHRAGTTTYQLTLDLRLVQDFLGHASPATTVIYTRPSTEALRTVLTQSALALDPSKPDSLP